MPILYVVWALALLSVIALGLFSTSNVSYRLSVAGLDSARLDAMTNAAVNRAVLALLDNRADRRWRSDGAPVAFDFNGTRMSVSVQDETGLIDLNHADGPILSRLLQSAGLDDAAAETLTEKILDWRDDKPFKRINGAKAQDYSAAGLSYVPRNGPFQAVDELNFVMDMTHSLFRRIRPAVTVYSGRSQFDPQIAPCQALLAMSGMDEGKAKEVIANRTKSGNALDSLGMGLGASMLGRSFTIRTETAAAHTQFVQNTTIRITNSLSELYWILNVERPDVTIARGPNLPR